MVDPDKSSVEFVRRPYVGSCCCGNVRYITWLKLPEGPVSVHDARAGSGLSIYKCNCTVCHKMGIFHLRLASAPDDFVILSPIDLGNQRSSRMTPFRANAKTTDRWFCSVCGVRPFSIRGELETAEIELPASILQKSKIPTEADAIERDATVKTPVLRLKKEGFVEDSKGGYFSLNAATLDAGQEGLDLRQWAEDGWIQYVDCLDRTEKSASKPHRGGMY